jgi:hypothetical protein
MEIIGVHALARRWIQFLSPEYQICLAGFDVQVERGINFGPDAPTPRSFLALTRYKF